MSVIADAPKIRIMSAFSSILSLILSDKVSTECSHFFSTKLFIPYFISLSLVTIIVFSKILVDIVSF